MSADRIEAVGKTYRSCAALFAAGGEVGPMLAYQEAAGLLYQASIAIRAAERSANETPFLGIDLTGDEGVTGYYQPLAKSVVVWTGGKLVEFSEGEAEAIRAALDDALSTRDRACALTLVVAGAAA